MKSMMEMQTWIESLKAICTDVRLLDADSIQSFGDDVEPPYSFGSREMELLGQNAAVVALATKEKQCRLQRLGADILHITACYYVIEGKPYVLELIQQTPIQNAIDPKEDEGLLDAIAGRPVKLYHDALTGVYNRSYYEDVVRTMIGPAGVAVMDLDDFKIYNDTYGHHAGDVALEAVADVLSDNLRRGDIVIRYGGDSFLLIMPGISSDYLKTKLEQVRAKVEAAVIPGYSHLHLSVSIGCVMQSLTDPMESAVRRAEKLMYRAKEQKNSVIVENAEEPITLKEALAQKQTKQRVMIVDDSPLNRAMLAEILQPDYRVLEVSDGEECLELMRTDMSDIALILLDINMPVMDGFEVLKAMNRNHIIEDVPVIMISSDDSEEAIRKAYDMGASDYVNRPFDAKVVYRRVFNTIKLYAKQRRLVQMVSDQIHKQEQNTTMLVGVLSQIVEFRNGESGSHVRHIRVITEKILNCVLERTTEYNISPEEQDNIPLASALHDIGKIAIDEKILNKPGRLTPEEFEIIKTHTTQGAEMLHKLENFEDEPLLQTAYNIARWHHERWDGRGYPDGLKGNEIPICAQIVSLADVYDALTSERCYKKAFPHEKAIEMILNGECGTFNPLLLDCLKELQGELRTELQNDYH